MPTQWNEVKKPKINNITKEVSKFEKEVCLPVKGLFPRKNIEITIILKLSTFIIILLLEENPQFLMAFFILLSSQNSSSYVTITIEFS